MPGISFVAAQQISTIRKTNGLNYNSTMTTGNLRTFGEAMFQAVFGTGDPDSANKAETFAAVSGAFLLGAVLGGVSTSALDNHALWIVDALLFALWLRLFTALRQPLSGG